MTVAFQPELAQIALTAPEITLSIPGWSDDPKLALKDVQARGISWLFATPRGLLADITGTGKTIIAIGTGMLVLTSGESGRLVYVVKSGLVSQWVDEWKRFVPAMADRVVSAQGLDKAERVALYRRPSWNVLVTSYDLMWRDAPHIAALQPGMVWYDESTEFKNGETRTHAGALQAGAYSPRIYCATATSIHNALVDLFSQMEVLGLAGSPNSVFGTREMFEARYLVTRHEQVRVRKGRLVTRKRVVGYTDHLPELTEKLRPYVLRRSEKSETMPEGTTEDIIVPMGPAQTAFYESIREGDYSKQAKATYLLEACSTPANLGGPDDSAKLDWLMDFLSRTGTEKVVVFARWLGTISAASRRMQAAGINYRVFAGFTTPNERTEARTAFREDPSVRVILLTTAGQEGLNLQVSRWVVGLDLMWNPARLEQWLGRVKREGSDFDRVCLIRLITPGTSEENILKVLAKKTELSDFVNGDESDLFNGCSDEDLRQIIYGVDP